MINKQSIRFLIVACLSFNVTNISVLARGGHHGGGHHEHKAAHAHKHKAGEHRGSEHKEHRKEERGRRRGYGYGASSGYYQPGAVVNDYAYRKPVQTLPTPRQHVPAAPETIIVHPPAK